MRFLDASKAIELRAKITAAIQDHRTRVEEGLDVPQTLSLEEFGIQLEPKDFDLEHTLKYLPYSCRKDIREDILILNCLRAKVNHAITHKRMYRNRQRVWKEYREQEIWMGTK